ncbi:MAG: class I SAM-dependent methyltransferase [Reyranellaceae bacterium]
MSAHSADSANADQIEYWNGVGGAQWLARHDRMEPQLAPLGLAAIEAAAPQPGERVIDIGCGTGTTSLRIADLVGERGEVLGVDVSEPLVEAARRNAAGRPNVQFLLGDAARHRLDGGFDLLFSRFGVMFFADPVAAFGHLRAALKPGGRLAFVCWRPFKENGWAFLPFMAAVPHLPPIERPAPNAPGPFAFGDDQRVRSVLTEAGFGDIAIKPLDRTMNAGTSVEDAAAFASDTGPISRVLNDASPQQRAAAVGAIRQMFEKRAAEGKGLALPAACWIVTARH